MTISANEVWDGLDLNGGNTRVTLTPGGEEAGFVLDTGTTLTVQSLGFDWQDSATPAIKADSSGSIVLKDVVAQTGLQPFLSAGSDSTATLQLTNVELTASDSHAREIYWKSSGDISMLGKVVVTIKLDSNSGSLVFPNGTLDEDSEIMVVRDNGNSTSSLTFMKW